MNNSIKRNMDHGNEISSVVKTYEGELATLKKKG